MKNTFETIESRNTITIGHQEYAMILGMAQTRKSRNEVGLIFENGEQFAIPAWEAACGKNAAQVLQQFCDQDSMKIIPTTYLDTMDWEVMNRIQYEFPAFFNETTSYRSEAADKRYVCRFVPVAKKAFGSILWDLMDCWNC